MKFFTYYLLCCLLFNNITWGSMDNTSNVSRRKEVLEMLDSPLEVSQYGRSKWLFLDDGDYCFKEMETSEDIRLREIDGQCKGETWLETALLRKRGCPAKASYSAEHGKGMLIDFDWNATRAKEGAIIIDAFLMLYQQQVNQNNYEKIENLEENGILVVFLVNTIFERFDFISATPLKRSNKSGWLKFDMKGMIDIWGKKNERVCVKIFSAANPVYEFEPELFGLFTNHSEELKPYFMVHFESFDFDDEHDKKYEQPINKNLYYNQAMSVVIPSPISDLLGKWANPSIFETCRLEDFYVDYECLGWGDWMIQPKGFAASICVGPCAFSIPFNLTAICHNLQDSNIPNPICSADLKQTLGFIETDENGKAEIKIFDKMIVNTFKGT